MTTLRLSKHYLAALAILVLVAGCGPDDGGGPAANATGGISAAANDFGGSGVVLNTSIAAPFVLFQNDSVSRLVNRDGGVVKPSGVNNIYSLGAYVDPNDSNRVKLFVNDRLNHRVLIFNNIPQDATALPDVVLGQADFASGTANAGVGTSALDSTKTCTCLSVPTARCSCPTGTITGCWSITGFQPPTGRQRIS